MLPKEIQDFINAPDTVDFVTRANDAFFQFVRDSGQVIVGQILSGRYVLGYIKEENFSHLLEALGAGFISSATLILGPLDRPDLEAAGIIQVQNQPYLNLKGRGVLLGFVDTGIDYTLPVFQYADGSSKIRFLYDQTAEGEPPQGFSTGVEYTGADIQRALAAEEPSAVVPQQDESGHGTFLASVAGGLPLESFTGAAPDAEIIAVKLRKARPFYRRKYCVPDWQEEAYSSSDVMVGVEYVLRKARELGRPVVICLGMGSNFGSHDGYSVWREYPSRKECASAPPPAMRVRPGTTAKALSWRARALLSTSRWAIRQGMCTLPSGTPSPTGCPSPSAPPPANWWGAFPPEAAV